MIFIKIKTEDIVQVKDKTRIDCRDIFLTPDEAAITLIEIQPEAAESFYDVTSNKFLDWHYATDGAKDITARVTTDATPTSEVATLSILSKAEDNLFSSDADLIQYEDDILSYIRNGRDSFLDKHRAAQREILDDLDSAKIWKRDQSRFTAADLIDIQDFKEWSKFLTLRIIYESLSNAIDDVFANKASKYQSMSTQSKSRAVLRLDYNDDGQIDNFEKYDIQTGLIFRQ